MSQTGFSRIYYQDSEASFFAENFGFDDPTPRDGVVQWSELDAQTQDFYKNVVTEEERAALFAYTSKNKLSCEDVNENATLMRIVQKYTRHRYYNETAAPREILISDKASPLPQDMRLPDRLFDKVTIDAASIRNDAWLKNAINRESSVLLASPITVKILRQLLLRHTREATFELTFSEWQAIYKNYSSTVGDTAESTWEEMIAAWQLSETDWHPIMNDIVAGSVSGGMVRVASSDMIVTARGMRRYVTKHRSTPPESSNKQLTGVVDSLDAKMGVVLSDKPSRITLVQDIVPGVDINLDLDPGAAILSAAVVHDGKLTSTLAEPLLYLKGFHINVDATSKVTKAMAAWGDMWWGLLGLDFDVSLEEIAAITVYQNRLCLVCRGIKNDNGINPVAEGKTAFIDIGEQLKTLMLKKGIATAVVNGLFTADGSIYDDVSVMLLQDAITEALQKEVLPKLVTEPKSRPKLARVALAADNVALNLGDARPLDNITVTDGHFSADYQSITAMSAEANFKLGFDFDNSHIGSFNGDAHFVADVFVRVDSQTGEAYARLTLPEFWLADLNKYVDGPYQGGEVTVVLSPEFFTALASRAPVDELIGIITADVLVDLKRSDYGYVVAAARLRGLATDENYLKTRALMAEFDVAVVDEDAQIYGIISGGEFYALTHFDGANKYLSGEYEVRAKTVLGSGIAQLFGGAVYGDDVVFVVSEGFDGTVTVRPHYKNGSLSGEYSVSTNNLNGEIRSKPNYENGIVTSYTVTTTGLALDVPSAAIQFKDNQTLRGKTRIKISQGQWNVAARSIPELLTTDADWLGSGNLKFESLDNNATLINNLTGQSTSVDAERFESIITINLMRFNPTRLAGSFEQKLSLGRIAMDSENFSLESDVQGEVSLVNVVYPVASFQTDATYYDQADPATATADAAHSHNATHTNTSTSAEVDAYYKPYLDRMQNSEAGFLSAVKVNRSGGASKSPEASLVALVAEIDDLEIYSEGDYHSNLGTIFHGDKVSRLPFFKRGALRLLNPKLREDTMIDIAANSILVYDGKLSYRKYKPTKKMHVLGVAVSGVEIKTPNTKSLEKDSARLVVNTSLGDVNPLALLNIFAHKKMKRVYEAVNRQLGLRLGPGEMPTRLADLSVFKDALAGEFSNKKGQESRASEDTLRYVESVVTSATPKKKAPIISLTDVKKIALHAELKPSEFDVGVVKVREPSRVPVSVDVLYMPGERDLSETSDGTPYLDVAIAAGPNEALPHLATDVINKQILINAEITQLSGIRFYASGPLDEASTIFNVHIDEVASDEKIEAIFLPKGYERPAFAIVIDGPGGKVDLRDLNVVGSVAQGFQVSADPKAVHFTQGDIFGFTMSEGDSEKPNEALLIMDGARFDDFHFELGMKPTTNTKRQNYFVYDPIIARGSLDTKGMHGYLYFGETGDDREFFHLTRVFGVGDVDVHNEKITYKGNIAIESLVPEAFVQHPLLAYLKKDLGLEIESISGVEVAGSLDLTMDRNIGRVTRLDESNAATEFVPTAITIKGNFKVRRGNQMVTISSLRVPLTDIVFEIIDAEQGVGRRPIVQNLTVPAGEEVSATISGHVVLPQSLGSGTKDIYDAQVGVTSRNDVSFSMLDSNTFEFSAMDFAGDVKTSDGQTVLAFNTGAVTFADDVATINDWDARLLFLELAQGVVSGRFHGKKAVARIKHSNDLDQPAIEESLLADKEVTTTAP